MKKIAVFGKPGSGKSTLSKALANFTGIELHQLDSMLYDKNGDVVDRDTYEKKHEEILFSDSWIIDGFDQIEPFYKRIGVADTLIYIDLPYFVSYYLVAKRLLKGLFIKPEGWPEGSSVIQGSIQSFKVLKLCPKFWNDSFLHKLQEMGASKDIYVIRSISDLNHFIEKYIAKGI
jgi:adenylate kinase family enzyme